MPDRRCGRRTHAETGAFVQPARRDDRSCRVNRRFVSGCLSRCLPSAGAFGFGFESHRPVVALDAASALPRRPPASRAARETRTLFIRMTNQLLDGRPSAGACLDACQRRRMASGPMAMRATHACDGQMKRTWIVGRDSVPSVIRSPRAEASWAPEIFGDSCWQHGALRFDLFSFSCPRLKYSLTIGMRPSIRFGRPARRRHPDICKERTISRSAMPGGAPQSGAAKRERPKAANVSELKRGSGEIVSGKRARQATAIESSMFCFM